jgi:hypothetical protein
MTSGLRVDSWTKLNTGDLVSEIDGRHIGRVEAIIGYSVRVKWRDSGWISDLPLDKIVRVERKIYDPRLGVTITMKGELP